MLIFSSFVVDVFVVLYFFKCVFQFYSSVCLFASFWVCCWVVGFCRFLWYYEVGLCYFILSVIIYFGWCVY